MITEIMDFRKELGKISPKANKDAKICFFGTGEYFEYLRRIYRCFAKINLEDFADCFIDNDINKQGKPFYGKPVISPDELIPDNAVVMICIAKCKPLEIQTQMIDRGFLLMNDLFSVLHMIRILKAWIFECFMQLKNKHSDERCFIIGNGSSLQSCDLDKLISEKTFAMNKIFKIFDKTKWRPTYYTCDKTMLATEHKMVNTEFNVKFLNFSDVHWLAKNKFDVTFDKTYYFSSLPLILERPAGYPCLFGEWPDLFFAGGTSAYLCLQLAAFMGFSRIYLLGIDNTNEAMRNNSGEFIFREDNCHITPDYHEKKLYFSMNVERTNSSYQVAREYCEQHGIKIYNATRGGELEVFERVDFDSLF